MSDPPGGPQPPPPAGGTSRGRSGLVVAVLGGALLIVPLSFFIFIGVISGGGVPARHTGRAILMAAIAIGGGGALCLIRSRYARGFGIGLMLGWALLSIFTAGECTGLAEIQPI